MGIGGLFLYLAFRGQDTEKLVTDLVTADYKWVILSALACLCSHVFRALRWGMLIKPLGHQPQLKNTFAAVMLGYLANLALPRLGEVSKCAALSKAEKIPANQLIGTMLVERIFDFLMLILVTALTLLVEFDQIAAFAYRIASEHYSNTSRNLPVLGLSLLLIFLVITAVWYLLRSGKVTMPAKFVVFWYGIRNGLFSVKTIESKSTFLFYTIMIWGMYLLSTYLCFYGLEATSTLGMGAALATLFFGSIGMTIPVQGGIGTYHFMVAQGLTAYAIDRADGLAYATIIHSSQTLVILVIGSISLFLLMLPSLQKRTNEKIRTVNK